MTTQKERKWLFLWTGAKSDPAGFILRLLGYVAMFVSFAVAFTAALIDYVHPWLTIYPMEEWQATTYFVLGCATALLVTYGVFHSFITWVADILYADTMARLDALEPKIEKIQLDKIELEYELMRWMPLSELIFRCAGTTTDGTFCYKTITDRIIDRGWKPNHPNYPYEQTYDAIRRDDRFEKLPEKFMYRIKKGSECL